MDSKSKTKSHPGKTDNILVTGGAGFIGSSLVEALLNIEKHVTVIDNLSGHIENIAHLRSKPNFTLRTADMFNEEILRDCVNKCNIVFHLSANADVRTGREDPDKDFRQNIMATYNLLNAMRKSPNCSKIIFTSSSTVYGTAQITPTHENYSPIYPISIYGASKLACEAIISGFCHMYNMSGTVVRLANIIGPRSRRGVIYDFISKLRTDPLLLHVLGDGTQKKSYLHVDDCVSALILLADLNSTFETFNIGSDDQTTVNEIASIVMNELGLKDVEVTYSGGVNGAGWAGDVKEMLLDCNKIKNLGWDQHYSSTGAVIHCVRQILNNH